MEAMVANSLASCDTDFGKKIVSLTGDSFVELWNYAIKSLQVSQPQAHHTVGPPLPEDSRQEREE